MISLVFNNQKILEISLEELRVLMRMHGRKLPYKVVLETDNEKDIAKLRKLGIAFKLEWTGEWS